MIRSVLGLCAVTLLIACSPQDEQVPTPETPSAQNPAAGEGATATAAPPIRPQQTAPADLAGEWRIAGVDDMPLDLPFGVALSVDDKRIDLSSGCIRSRWTYVYYPPRIATERAPAMSCERGLRPEEEAIEAALSSATDVVRTPENGVRFSGDGHSVTLFSQ